MGLVARPVYQSVPRAPSARPLPIPQPRRVDEALLAAFGCDVSFISDDATPAEELVTRAVEQATSHDVKHLVWEIFDRVRADYQANSWIGHPAGVATRIRQAASAMGVKPSAEQHQQLLRFFNDVNHILFQHQALSWLAGESGLKFHLYGRGWEYHPALARHARGVIRDERMRQAIYTASKINLSIGAYGAVTPRLLEGVARGGFFLMRFCPADVIEKFYAPLLEFCAARKIQTNRALRDEATPGVRALLAFASRTLGVDVVDDWPEFVPHLLSVRGGGTRSRSAAVLWPEQYGQVCFGSRDEMLNLVNSYLYDEPRRRQVADGMRRALTEHPPQRVSVQVAPVATAPRPQGEVAA